MSRVKTDGANAANNRRGHKAMVAKLRAAGYTVIEPAALVCDCYPPYVASTGRHYCAAGRDVEAAS